MDTLYKVIMTLSCFLLCLLIGLTGFRTYEYVTSDKQTEFLIVVKKEEVTSSDISVIPMGTTLIPIVNSEKEYRLKLKRENNTVVDTNVDKNIYNKVYEGDSILCELAVKGDKVIRITILTE